MKAGKLAAGAVLILAAVATSASGASASSVKAGIKWSSVSGRLHAYTAGTSATVSVTNGTKGTRRAARVSLKVSLAFTTGLEFATNRQAPPLMAPGDGVLVKLKWVHNKPHAEFVEYLPHGAVPTSITQGGEQGTSRFHGFYDQADSSANVLAVKSKAGTEEDFSLTPDTVYFEAGQQIANPSLTDGERLGVEATQQSSGAWTADTLIVGDQPGNVGAAGVNEEFAGYYQASTPGAMTMLEKGGGDAQAFNLTSRTKYYDQNGNQVPTLTYYSGEACHVFATQQPDGTWTARRVRLGAGDNGGEGDNHTFRGTYVSSDADSVTVTDPNGNTETFSLNSNTLYFDKSGDPVGGLDYAAGQKLWVTAAHQPDGSWLATQVNDSKPSTAGSGEVTEDFGGTYASDTSASLTITAQGNITDTFGLTADTQYFDQSGDAVNGLTYTDAEPLRVVGVQQTDGSWVATMVIAFPATTTTKTASRR